MFSTDDEDGDFLSPTGGAKLASLFGIDQAANQGNESFQYTAPKQPRKGSMNSGPPTQKPPPPGAPAVLLATAVHAYRYVNGQYMKQGKLGAAVLGNHATKEYKLLLYASQQKPVTSAKLHTGFLFTVQPSNYCTFYDDQRQNWSVMFETDKAALDFCKEVCLAKANSATGLDTVVVQDLTLGEGQAVEIGDSMEVAYTGWLLQNHTTGQVFDSNMNKEKLLRLKLGAGKVIKGWEEGMGGMKKGGKRFLVIPPNQAYGSQGVANRVPADSTLLFEAEVKRVKFSKDSGSSVGSRDSAAPSPAPSVESLGPEAPSQPPSASPAPPKQGDAPLRAKSNSISEQLTNPDVTKAKLISRMAKMGQPMLPFLAGQAQSPHADSSDSEMEDPNVSRAKERPMGASPQPVQITTAPPTSVHVTSHPHMNPTAALMPVTMATAAPQPMMPGSLHAFQPYAYTQSVAPSHLQPGSEIYAGQAVPYQGPRDVTSFLMTEARQHNTEIRLAVGKVADKVDQLTAKMDDMQRQSGPSLGFSNFSMETTMIMHNIQRIIQENECLKKEVFEKSARIEEQNRKIGELINQNQRYMEQSNLLMEQRNDSLKSSSEHNQARLLQAEQDKARLTEELASSTARVSELQLEVSSQQQRSSGLQAKLNTALQERDQHASLITTLQRQLEEVKESGERAQTQYKAEKQKRKEVELKLSSIEEEVQDLTTEKDSLERTLADRKRKWQSERERCDEDLEELRRSSQQELDNLRSQLRKAKTSTAAQEQLSQLQAELEQEWQAKCDQSLAAAKEQQGRALAELTEQRDGLELKLTQLQEKFTALKQSRESEEQQLLQQQEQSEELQALKEKHAALEGRAVAMRQQYETRVAELERRLEEPQQQGSPEQADTAMEVKRVMNGVFHSLRGEFGMNESYTGSAIIGVLVNTIKNVTLQLLAKNERTTSEQSSQQEEEEDGDEEEDDDEEEEEEAEKVEKVAPSTQVNGKREELDDEEKEIDEKEVERRTLQEVEETSTLTLQEVKDDGGAPAERGEDKHAPAESKEDHHMSAESQEDKGTPAETLNDKSKESNEDEGKEKVPEENGDGLVSDEQTAERPDDKVEEEVHADSKESSIDAHTEPPTNLVPATDTTDKIVGGHADHQNATETAAEEPSKEQKAQELLVSEEDGLNPPPHTPPSKDSGKHQHQGKITSPLGDAIITNPPHTPPSKDSGTHQHHEKITSPLGDAIITNIRSGPPTQPPPPPPTNVSHVHANSKSPNSISLTGGVEEENGGEPFFKTPPALKPPPTPTEDEDEELSLKGRPPPAPLFGEDDDEDDLDWLS
ncbi:FK506-binding protein 15 isoform X2 [Engraulis encrasicolus]|uniref:FK506-binding protein 15 isoform X2 n=1 Tax=Engraulis encrasicolus TaxID=184585 RepID=UPI002FD59110